MENVCRKLGIETGSAKTKSSARKTRLFFHQFWYDTLTKDDKNPDKDKNPESLEDLY